jgi:type VII secretion protein EccB
LGDSVPRHPTTWLHVSAHRFSLRRIECALLGRDLRAAGVGMRAQTASVALGGVLTAAAVAACALLALLRPQVALDRAQIVMGQESGALYVRVGDTWHPVLNLVSARLIAATAANPQPVRESELAHTKRGPLLGIPGAPQSLGEPLPAGESAWTLCDTEADGSTAVIVGRTDEKSAQRLTAGQAALVAPASGSSAYLLYDGQRAVVDRADAAVLRALRLEGRAPRPVSQALLNAIPEAPPIRAPRIAGAGAAAPGLPGLEIGSVVRVTRGDGDEYYAVLAAGIQRIGQVAADLMRFSNSRGTANAVTVAPDAIRAVPVVGGLPVGTFPDRAPTVSDGGGALCASWEPGGPGVAILTGSRLPIPDSRAPVALSQADGRGPALDAVYLPPGRSAYVRESAAGATRYLITDTGVRFAIHDDDAERDLGLRTPTLAPWPVLKVLPPGPELSRRNASVAWDRVVGSP